MSQVRFHPLPSPRLPYCRALFVAVELALACAILRAAPHPSIPADATEALRVYAHDVWQVENGLPQDAVQAITQTKDGYLWLGTEQGVVRFDGVRFTVFNRKNTPALKNSYTRTLYADSDGALWIGMASGASSAFEMVPSRALRKTQLRKAR